VAHVEATTELSILLAGVYLKVGYFGYCRYVTQVVADAVASSVVAIASQPYAISVLPEWLLALGNGSVSLKGIVLLLGVGAALWIVGVCSYNQVTTGRSRASSSCRSCADTRDAVGSGGSAGLAFSAWSVGDAIVTGLTHTFGGFLTGDSGIVSCK